MLLFFLLLQLFISFRFRVVVLVSVLVAEHLELAREDYENLSEFIALLKNYCAAVALLLVDFFDQLPHHALVYLIEERDGAEELRLHLDVARLGIFEYLVEVFQRYDCEASVLLDQDGVCVWW